MIKFLQKSPINCNNVLAKNQNIFRITHSIITMAGPLIGSRMGGVLSGFVNMIMISQLGHAALATSALINSILFSFVIPLWMLFIAVGILVAQAHGANQPKEIGKITRQGLILATIIGIPGTAALYWIKPILIWLGQEQQLAILAQEYFRAYAWSFIPSLWFSCLTQFTIGISQQKITLLFTLLFVPLVTISGYILLFGKLGCHAFGISGIGYANVIASIITDIILIIYLLNNSKYSKYSLLIFDLKQNLHYLKQIFVIGWPITLMIASELIIVSFSIMLIGWLGESSLAAEQICLQINMVAFMIPMGIGQASTILISQEIGRKNYQIIRQLGYIGIILALISMGFVLIVYLAVPKLLISLFLNIHSNLHINTINLAISFLAAVGIMNLADGVRCVATCALRGLRDTMIPMFIFIVLGCVLSLPLSYLLAVPLKYGAIGYYEGFIIGYFIGAIVLIYRFHKRTTTQFLTQFHQG